MNCDPLALTGPGLDPVLVLLLAITCLLGGAGLLLAARKRRLTGALLLIPLLVVAGFTFAGPPPAMAATSDCSTPDNSLTITQTSTMDNLAPDATPQPITGTVRNNGADSTRIATVLAEITSVTTSPTAPEGACDPSDYQILQPRMTVDAILTPGAAAAFAGASIQLTNLATNQDACKLATIHLLYTANPT